MSGLLDFNPALRTADEWRGLLAGLVESLSAHVGRPFQATSWFIHDDRPGYASSCNCVDIRAMLIGPLALEACGVICVTVNFGEAAWARYDLLLFASGCRIKGPRGMDLIALNYDNRSRGDHVRLPSALVKTVPPTFSRAQKPL
jgi:hypothetical protein